jgi:RsiW-degrading membrane proteinase PrsW (M82 family)
MSGTKGNENIITEKYKDHMEKHGSGVLFSSMLPLLVIVMYFLYEYKNRDLGASDYIVMVLFGLLMFGVAYYVIMRTVEKIAVDCVNKKEEPIFKYMEK